MCDVLWVDDQIQGLSTYVAALALAGYNVSCSSTVDQAIALVSLESNHYDLILVDLVMPVKSGFDFIDFLIRDKQFVGCIAALSSYLYLDEYRKRLSVYEQYVVVIDKDFPPITATDFTARFLDPIAKAATGRGKTWSERESTLFEQGGNPFDLDFETFMLLPIEKKDQISEQARSIAYKAVMSEFVDGKIWVMLCGDPQIVRASALELKDVMTDDSVLRYGRLQGRVPFVFYRPVDVEDTALGWNDCGKGYHLDSYPTLQFAFRGGKELLLHFDTGSPFTFFSYEELLDKQVILPGSTLFTRNYRGSGQSAREFWCATLSIDALIVKDESGDTRNIVLNGLIVRDWLNAPFVRHCRSQRCVQLSNVFEDGANCRLRVALIGRNLLTDNNLKLLLDGHSRRSIIIN